MSQINTEMLYPYPYIQKRMVELIMPNLKNKPLLEDLFIDVGALAVIPKREGQKAFALISEPEGSEEKVIFDFTPYTLISVMPYRVHVEYPFDTMVIREGMTPVIYDGMRRTAKAMVKIIEDDVMAAFNGQFPKKPNKNKSYGYFVVKYPLRIEIIDDVRTDKTILCVSARYCPVAFPNGIKKVKT